MAVLRLPFLANFFSVLEGRTKSENLEENLLGQRIEPKTTQPHMASTPEFEYVVLNENAISKCTALVTEHVISHKYILADILRVMLVLKGPA